MSRPAPDSPPGTLFRFGREHFALLNLLWLGCGLLNVMVAVVTGSENAYRLVPCWFLLLAISAASSFLIDMKVVVWFATVALCSGVEFLRYRAYHGEIMIRTFAAYAPLTTFMLVLFSTAVEQRRTEKEHAQAHLQKLRSEASDLLNHLNKMRSGEMEKGAQEQEKILATRKSCFEFYQEIFPRVLQIRFKRDIPPLLHVSAEQGFGLQAGIVYEIPEDKRSEIYVRASWGLPKTAQAEAAVARFAKGDLVRRCSDERAPFDMEAIKRQPNLYEESDQFAKELFPIETVAPVLLLGKTLFVMIAGLPSPKGRVPYEFQLLNPLIQGCGQAISKLAQKDGRKSFSTFGA